MPRIRFRTTTTLALALAAAAIPGASPAHAGFTQIGTLGTGSGGGAGQMDGPYRADAGPDGSVYVVDRNNVRIVKFNSAGAFERAWGKNVSPSGGSGFEVCTATCQAGVDGSAAGDMNFLWDVAVSPGGEWVYVSDYFNARVNQYESDGDFVRSWGWDVVPGGATGFETCTTGTGCKFGTSGAGAGQLDRPGGIAVGPSGDVYVLDNDNERVSQFTASGDVVRSWGWNVDPGGGTGLETCTATCQGGQAGSGEGQLNNAFAIGVAANGDVLAASDNDYVNRYSATGAYLGRFGGSGTQPGQLDDPRSVDVGPSGEVVLTASSPGRIERFGADLGFLETFSLGFSILDNPYDAAFAPDGTVYVPQFQSLADRVLRYALSPVSVPPVAPPAPTPTPTPTPPVPAAPAAPAPPAALPKAASVIVLPSARSCVSRRNFRIRLKQPKGFKLKRATVALDGKRVATRSGARVTAPVDLRGLPKGRFTVKIAVTLDDGRVVRSTRTYRTCAPRRR